MHKSVYILRKYRVYIAVFFFIIILCLLGLYQCPLRFIFGIPCPFCGFTRAIICLFNLNFKASFYYQALWPLVVFGYPIYLLFIDKNNNISKKNKDFILITFALLFLIYYVIRQISNSEIVQIDFEKSFIYRFLN